MSAITVMKLGGEGGGRISTYGMTFLGTPTYPVCVYERSDDAAQRKHAEFLSHK